MKNEIWLVGAGPMAIAHAKVLKAMGRQFKVIGRGGGSAESFRRATGLEVETGGIDDWLCRSKGLPAHVIVTVNVDYLTEATIALIKRGIRHVLVEKPAGVDFDEIDSVAKTAADSGAQVFVAYNRRFLASTLAARQIIRDDGGITSYAFEFTERAHVVEALSHPDIIKQNWFLVNSTHVIDLAFFLCGEPKQLAALTSGCLSWHKNGARFVGCGVSEMEVPFSYYADWTSAGGWGVEINTPRRRLILRPLEQLFIQTRGSSLPKSIELNDKLDKEYKPGIYRQMDAFLNGAGADLLLDVRRHANRARSYLRPMLRGFTSLQSCSNESLQRSSEQ